MYFSEWANFEKALRPNFVPWTTWKGCTWTITD